MSRSNRTGTALMCLAVLSTVVASCDRQRSSVGTKQNDLQELESLVQATKNHPSLRPGSNEAGPPIQVDPYPHSAGMAGMSHNGMGHEEPSHGADKPPHANEH